MKDKMPTLQQNQKSCNLTLNQSQLFAAHLFLPNPTNHTLVEF